MKAISVKQPWAYLICSGIKDIENRTWRLPEKHKGKRVLISSSAKSDANVLFTPAQKAEIDKWKTHNILGFDTGVIIGSVVFTDCVVNHHSIWAEKTGFYVELEEGVYLTYGQVSFSVTVLLDHANIYTSEYEANRALHEARKYNPIMNAKVMPCKHIYNWVVTDPILFDHPIPCNGKLSFWNFDIPKDRRHHHFWIEDGILYETYWTIRGNRYRELYKVNYPDRETVSDEELSKIEILNA